MAKTFDPNADAVRRRVTHLNGDKWFASDDQIAYILFMGALAIVLIVGVVIAFK